MCSTCISLKHVLVMGCFSSGTSLWKVCVQCQTPSSQQMLLGNIKKPSSKLWRFVNSFKQFYIFTEFVLIMIVIFVFGLLARQVHNFTARVKLESLFSVEKNYLCFVVLFLLFLFSLSGLTNITQLNLDYSIRLKMLKFIKAVSDTVFDINKF